MKTETTLLNPNDAKDSGGKTVELKDVSRSRKLKDEDAGDEMKTFEDLRDFEDDPHPKDEDAGDGGKVETFEDLMELVGFRGRWNLCVILVCAFSTFTSAFSAMSYQFLGWTPDYWCSVPELTEANWTQQQIISLASPFNNVTRKPEGCLMHNYNYTAAALLGYEKTMADISAIMYNGGEELLACPTRFYNTSTHPSSIVTEWDLTCERRALYSTSQAMSQVGTMAGSVAYGYIFDALGRRKGVLISTVLSLISTFITIAAPNVETYLFFRFFYQASDFGYYMGCVVIAMEVCSPSQRNHVGALYLLPWTLGYMLMPWLAYAVRPWRWLQAVLSLPVFYCLTFFWLMPESPRWLILHDHHQEALNLLKKASALNRTTLPPDDWLLAAMCTIRDRERAEKMENVGKRECGVRAKVMGALKRAFMLILTPGVRMKALIVFYLWAASASVYYGISLSSYNLSTDTYMYTFLNGLLEIPAYLFLWATVGNLGRRKTLVILFFFCGASISSLAALMLTLQEVPDLAKLVLSLGSKVAITACYQLVWVFTTELFSTKYRARATGEASLFCRLGSIASPYINDIMGELVVWGPSLLFSLISFVAALVVFLLPETTNKNLPQGNPEAEDTITKA